MDTLYIGDIPPEYHFARFSSYYVDLFNTDVLDYDRNYDFYRVYLYDNYFTYEKKTSNSGYSSYSLVDIPVSSEKTYRRDFPEICNTVLIFSILFIFLINIFTSIFKRGGVFGNLL